MKSDKLKFLLGYDVLKLYWRIRVLRKLITLVQTDMKKALISPK
ncbi:MAG: hypothetical protein ACP5HX_00325 [Thermoproteota archaeon]|jgi:hypothetical protein